MLPRKTAPAPVFNYRKRQRQAVFADPENHPAPTTSTGPSASPQCDGSAPQPPPATFSNPNRGRTGRSLNSEGDQLSAARRPAASAVGGLSKCRGQGGSWDGRFCGQSSSATAINQHTESSKEWSARQTSTRQGVHRPSSGYIDRCLPRKDPKLIDNAENRPTTTPRQLIAAQSKKIVAGESPMEEAAVGSDQTLRVLTLPTAHLKRVFRLHVDRMPPLMFIVFGIVDSATVLDRATSGKSFVLRDESGSITCVFCEIDRQMPRLHRGQWYRVVGVMKPTWEAVQCLSLRPVTLEERLAARAVTSLGISLLNNLLSKVTEQ